MTNLKAITAVLCLALAACHDVVAPKDCTSITQRGLHADTTVTRCRYE